MKTIKGYYYHVYNRSIDKVLLFEDSADYKHFLSLIKKYSQLYSISINAYCLIPNHYHFLLYQKFDIPISKFLQSVNNAYVQGINKWTCYISTDTPRSHRLRHGGVTNDREETTKTFYKGV
ncbi:MAG: transposase [Candidatus Marinimicrobia bacterium]|nr:transposase [Candidatus Neomarinimicrobiota bacterium]